MAALGQKIQYRSVYLNNHFNGVAYKALYNQWPKYFFKIICEFDQHTLANISSETFKFVGKYDIDYIDKSYNKAKDYGLFCIIVRTDDDASMSLYVWVPCNNGIDLGRVISDYNGQLIKAIEIDSTLVETNEYNGDVFRIDTEEKLKSFQSGIDPIIKRKFTLEPIRPQLIRTYPNLEASNIPTVDDEDPKVNAKNIISVIFGHSKIRDNTNIQQLNAPIGASFTYFADYALTQIYKDRFSVIGKKSTFSGIFEYQFSDDAFIANFVYESEYESKIYALLRQLSEDYGLFCVFDIQTHNIYVWLPKNNSSHDISLPMMHDLEKISTLNAPSVNLYNTYKLTQSETLMMFKQKEYDDLKTKIAEEIRKKITPPPPAPPPPAGGRYTTKTLKELQAIAKARKLPYSNLKKAELIALLRKR